MVGLGMDSDGHKRITTGDNFVVAGGTQDTHDQMTEKVVKINEKLTERGKCLNTVEHTAVSYTHLTLPTTPYV